MGDPRQRGPQRKERTKVCTRKAEIATKNSFPIWLPECCSQTYTFQEETRECLAGAKSLRKMTLDTDI